MRQRHQQLARSRSSTATKRRRVGAALGAAALLATAVGCAGDQGTDDAAVTVATVTPTTVAPTVAPPTTATPATIEMPRSDLVIAAWSAAPSLLHPRAAHGVVAEAGSIYVLGGIDETGSPVLAVERFDGATWTDLTTLPGTGLNAPSVAALDGRIYVIGGFTGTSAAPTDEVHVYDIATSTWSTAAPLPTASGGHAAAVLDGRIHVVGGGTSSSTIADHVMYDPSVDRWTTAAPLPRAKGSPAVAVLDGRLWSIGGRSGRSDFGDVDIYDPTTDTWMEGPEIEERGNAGAVASCGTVMVVGGQRQGSAEVLADVLVLGGDTWRPVAPLPTARAFARTVALGDTIYVVGGATEYGQSHATPGGGTVEFTTPEC